MAAEPHLPGAYREMPRIRESEGACADHVHRVSQVIRGTYRCRGYP